MPFNVFTFVPAFGHNISAATFLCSHSIQQTLASKGIGGGVSTMSFPDIAELRDMALTIWYDTMPQSTHILQIDADIGFHPDLLLDLLLFDEPVVGAIYAQRKFPLSWAGSGSGGKTTERRGNFMKVEGIPFGCGLIRRDAITHMLQVMPDIVDTRLALHPAHEMLRQSGVNRLIRAFDRLDIPERGLVSEDLSFCIRWNRCGGSVWSAIGHKISHVGQHDFGANYLESLSQQQAAAEKADQEEKQRRQATQAIIAIQQDYNATKARLAAYEAREAEVNAAAEKPGEPEQALIAAE
jgi:hypothetical protein